MRVLLGLTAVAATLALAVPAHADIDNDQDFLTDLRDAGITYQDPSSAITIGKAVCDLLEDGQSGAKVVTDLRNQNPAFQGASAAHFTYLSASHYCPKYVTGEERGAKPDGVSGN